MKKKLTLLLDENVIGNAKLYAEKHNESLSGMVENYFRYLASKGLSAKQKKKRLPGEIQELIGIVQVPADLDVKKEYRKHKAAKYAK